METPNNVEIVKGKRDFTTFKKALNDIASESLNTYYNGKGVRKTKTTERKTPEEVEEILLKGNETELRNLSRLYWDISGLYKRLILYFANMLTYDILVTPKVSAGKTAEKDKMLKMISNYQFYMN